MLTQLSLDLTGDLSTKGAGIVGTLIAGGVHSPLCALACFLQYIKKKQNQKIIR